MGLTKCKLGKLLESCDERNIANVYSLDDVKGISIQKIFIDTKADMQGVSLTSYKLVKPDDFVYVTVTSRNGEKITLAHNSTDETYLVSSSYIVFKVSRPDLLLSDYLFMYFNRPEFDRYSRYNSWGSARETFDWREMCDIDFELPPIEIQQKYVNIYNALLANQRSYEAGIDDLKIVCDGFIEDLRRKNESKTIGEFLILRDERYDGKLTVKDVRGIATSKQLIPTKANMMDVGLSNYKIVRPSDIVYVSDTSRRDDKMSIGQNQTANDVLVSAISTVFYTDEKFLLAEYLMLWICRGEFDRYARFHSWGSARETFEWDEMRNVKIPIPSIDVQQDIVNIFKVYNKRKEIGERIKAQIKDICPILIKGSIEEAIKEA